MAGTTRLELATSCVTGMRSNQTELRSLALAVLLLYLLKFKMQELFFIVLFCVSICFYTILFYKFFHLIYIFVLYLFPFPLSLYTLITLLYLFLRNIKLYYKFNKFYLFSVLYPNKGINR